MTVNKAQLFGAIAGPVTFQLSFVGLIAAHFLPPIAPMTSVNDVVAHYTTYATGIRLCAISMLFLLTGLLAQYTCLSDQMKTIQSPAATAWAGLQVTLGGISLVPFYGTAIAWALASYRVDRFPEITLTLNDVGWFCLVMPVAPAFLQLLSVGFAVLSDQGATPRFPRWYGFLSLWAGILFLTGLLVPFFKTGPFAWNGILAFWLPAVVFGGWVNVTAVLMVGLAKRHDAACRFHTA